MNVSAHVQGEVHPTAMLEGAVFVAAGATVGPGALIQGPAWIGPGADVGHGALVRGGVILARGAKVGHASEIKHAVLLEDAKAPHFNYVGDSIVGARVNLGAGVKLANFRADGAEVKVEGQATGLRKFGAILGDDVSIGCNAVTSPGTVIGPRSLVYPGASVRGVFAAESVIKRPFDTPITGD
jgi:bifunctional UDP-N-acetylglucosamine pyrophosphorylase/glucosamine-1-phosphate N-acetyltransferase